MLKQDASPHNSSIIFHNYNHVILSSRRRKDLRTIPVSFSTIKLTYSCHPDAGRISARFQYHFPQSNSRTLVILTQEVSPHDSSIIFHNQTHLLLSSRRRKDLHTIPVSLSTINSTMISLNQHNFNTQTLQRSFLRQDDKST
jgi:hypothetical protein